MSKFAQSILKDFLMTKSFPVPTFTAKEFFKTLDQKLGERLKDPKTAVPDEICGFVLSTKSDNGHFAYSLGLPVETFLVATEGGGLIQQNFEDIDPEKQTEAALIAMRANLMRSASMECIQSLLHDMDDEDGAFYMNILVLPHVAILSRDMYEDMMEIDFDFPEDLQDGINQHFALLRREHRSSHEGLKHYEPEHHQLELLTPLVPIKEDFTDPDAPHIKLKFCQ